jgi:uncharacterized protein (TIGR02246 family)
MALEAQDSARSEEDEQAVRACINQYVEAFNQGDAQRVAELWSESGVWISPDGSRLVGREAIGSAMQSYFDEGASPQLTVMETTVRLLAPTVAVEEGRARVVRSGEAPSESTYIAIHVKQREGWRLDSVRETAVPSSSANYEYLKPLEWLVGTWIDRDDRGELETTCEWTTNKNFMTRSFRVKIDGETTKQGTQVIGYDAVSQKIRSWVFDTDGGIGEGTWYLDGNRWIVKSSHRLASGQLGSSINILTPVDQQSFLWQSTGRELDGEILPDIEPVTVVRK